MLDDARDLDRRLRALEGSTTGTPLLQAKRESVTTNASGEATITFPTAFAAVPAVVVTVEAGTNLETAAWVESVTSSSFKVNLWRNGALDASATRTVHWIAREQS